jgi:hypothetical protein
LAHASYSGSARAKARDRPQHPVPIFEVADFCAAPWLVFPPPLTNGERIDVETAFKNPKHPFRVAIVCAMWLTGFDVECLSTLYIDKPMKAHTLMQAIARANRVYPGKDFGLIVDYNGMLASLRAALAQYALGDDGTGGEEIIAPIEERVQALNSRSSTCCSRITWTRRLVSG